MRKLEAANAKLETSNADLQASNADLQARYLASIHQYELDTISTQVVHLDSCSSMCEPALRGHGAHVLPNFALSILAVVTAPTKGHAHHAPGGLIVPAGADAQTGTDAQAGTDAQPAVQQVQQRLNSPVHNYAFLTGVTSGNRRNT
jgi:hypothetical protein